MIVVLKLIVITSLLVLGWKIVTSDEMALEKVGEWATKKVEEGNRFYEWLICEWCMPSVWGILGYVMGYITGIVSVNLKVVYAYPLVVCGSSLLCGLTWTLYETLNSIKESNRNAARYFDNNSEKTYLEVKKMKAEYNLKNKK